jgi:hypothetical protein
LQATVTVASSILQSNGTPWNQNKGYDGIAIRNTAVQLIPAKRVASFVTVVAPDGDSVTYVPDPYGHVFWRLPCPRPR